MACAATKFGMFCFHLQIVGKSISLTSTNIKCFWVTSLEFQMEIRLLCNENIIELEMRGIDLAESFHSQRIQEFTDL
jgi:hypothetical protein